MKTRDERELSPEMWEHVQGGSDDLAEELDLGPRPFRPRALHDIDEWLDASEGPLDEGDVARLGLYLARMLVEEYGGGLVLIDVKGHDLDGEWAVTDFKKVLAEDFHVPFMVSAARIARSRSLGAREWHEQLLREARREPAAPSKGPSPRR